MTTGKTIALTRRTFVGKVMSLLFNMLFNTTFMVTSKPNYFLKTPPPNIITAEVEVGLPCINLGEGNTNIRFLALCKIFSNAGRPRGLFLQGLYLPSVALHSGLKKIFFFFFFTIVKHSMGLPDGSAGKDSACDAGDTGDAGSIPGWARSPGGGNATHSSILAWKIPWTEEPGGLQSLG